MARRATSPSANSKANTIRSSTRPESTRARARTLSVSSLLGEVDEGPETDIRSYTFEELREMRRRGDFVPTRPDAEKIELDDSFWAHAKWMPPLFPRKTSVHLRLDQDVLDWFKGHGKGHLTRMNAVLRTFVYSQKNRVLRESVAAEAVRKNPKAKSAPRKKAAKRAAAGARQHKKTSRS
jgi:uncharacterized protein (DUF4415 family)